MNDFDVIVIGAGPAGLLAAGRAAELGGKVLAERTLQRSDRVGSTSKTGGKEVISSTLDQWQNWILVLSSS